MKILIVLALTLFGTNVSMAEDLVCTLYSRNQPEIVFVIDASANGTSQDLVQHQQLAVDIAAAFFKGPDGIRFSAIIFNRRFLKLVLLDTFSTSQNISQALSSTRPFYRFTDTAAGLDMALLMMSYARPDQTKIVIFITAGLSSSQSATREAAMALKNNNVTTIAIGVEQARRSELLDIASQPDYVFEVNAYSVYQDFKDDVIIKSCLVTDGIPHQSCPVFLSWIIYNRCYTIHFEKMTLADAAQTCAATIGGKVVEPRTPQLYSILSELAEASTFILWAGAKVAAEGDWRWLSDNSSATTEKNQFSWENPNNWGGNDDCLEMQPNRKVNNADCGKKLPFICTKDGNPAFPTNWSNNTGVL